MEYLTLLIKPISGSCNLRCRYCFYEDVTRHRTNKNKGCMNEMTVREVLYAALKEIKNTGLLQIVFQGGEPTLAGLTFFRRFLEIEQEIGFSSDQINHSIQTNGMFLDENWAEFLNQNHFLVGLSLDGSKKIHNAYRRDADGKGTWNDVVKSLQILKKHHVETNLLCVVNNKTAAAPKEVYKSLTRFEDLPLQFIPCLDPIDEARGSMPFSLRPEPYGNFLCDVFDLWFADLQAGKYRSIRYIDDYLRLMMRMPASSCSVLGQCGSYLAVEADGSLYPCDFYVLDEWCLGNIHDISIEEAVNSPINRQFMESGRKLPQKCSECSYFYYCKGGCKRDRFLVNGDINNYYCESYKMFFRHALPCLHIAARILFQV